MRKAVAHDKLLNRDFLLLWQGMSFSALGSILYSISIGYWVYETTGSTAWMGIMSSVTMFTMMVLGPITGALTDRMHRRNVLIYADIIRGIIFLIVGYFAYNNLLSVLMVIIVAFISGICGSFFSPAASSLFPDLLPSDELVRGESIGSGTDSLIRLVGSAVSGALIVMLGVPMLIIINGISYLISAISECFITPIRTKNQATKISPVVILGDIKEGASFVFKTPGLSTMMISALTINLFASGFYTLLIAFVLSKGLSMIQYGVIAAASSLGGLVGMFFISFHKIKSENRYAVSIYSFIVSGILMIIGISLGSYIYLIIFMFVAEFLSAIGNALLNAAFILYTPQEKRGMITGFVASAAIGGSALSALLYGLLGELISLTILGIFGNFLAIIPLIIILMDKNTREIFVDKKEKIIKT